jgi:hypothetical protein
MVGLIQKELYSGKIRSDLGDTGLLLDPSLDFQEYARLPVIQLRDLIKLNNSSGKHLLVTLLESFDENVDKFGFPCG